LAGWAASASAATIGMQFTWTGTLYESGFNNTTYIQSDDAIGIYAFNVQSASGVNVSAGSTLYSVCLSPAGLLDGGQYTYNVIPFSQANPGIFPSNWAWNNPQNLNTPPQYWGVQNAAYLWSTFGMNIVNNTGNVGYQSQRAAALEFAVWTALYDSTGYGSVGSGPWAAPTGTGQGQMDSTTLAYYNQYMSVFSSSPSTTLINSIQALTGNILEGQGALGGPPPPQGQTGQSQEFFFLATPVPEPTACLAAVCLLALPLGASVMRILRRNRQA